MKSSDLLPLWLNEAVVKARQHVKETDKGYDALKNKTTTYAKSILYMRNARREVLKFWEQKQKEAGSDGS
jgi:dsDNA-binding SOS-regulon protein